MKAKKRDIKYTCILTNLTKKKTFNKFLRYNNIDMYM